MKKLDSMDQGKILDIIRRIEFFNAFSFEDKQRLATFHGKFYLVQANETIVREDDEGSSLYILISGAVNVCKGSTLEVLAELGPGDIFGEVSFLTQIKRISSCVAAERSIILEVDHMMLNNLGVEVREKFKDQIILKLIDRLNTMNARLQDAMEHSEFSLN